MGNIKNAELKEILKDMNIVFEDNFDTPELDMTKWDFTDYMAGYSDMPTLTTSEVQSIVKDENGNSFLRLTAKRTGENTFQSVKTITTGNKLTFIFGYLEIRAKVPTVKGAWPSVWLKSNTKNPHLGWHDNIPYNIEVDVFEVMGGNAARPELHKWVQEPFADKRTGTFAMPNVYSIIDNDWHTYGMLWTKDCINMYVDGILYQSYDLNKDFSDDGKGMDGFRTEALCISFNNHLFTPEYNKSQTNGWVFNKVLDESFTESIYDIDYVRLYQGKDGILNKAD